MADDDDIFKQFEEETSDFFSQLLGDASTTTQSHSSTSTPASTTPTEAPRLVPAPALVPAPKSAAEQMRSKLEARRAEVEAAQEDRHDIEDEYEAMFADVSPSKPTPSTASALPKVAQARGSAAPAAVTPPAAPQQQFVMFDLEEAEEGVDEEHDAVHSPYVADHRTPEAPPPLEEFSAEDLALREALSDFYFHHRPENLSNLNSIVAKYRGRNVCHLWAQLVLKYGLEPWEGVQLFNRTMYLNSLFEYTTDEEADVLTQGLEELRREVLIGGASADRSDLFQRCIVRCGKSGSDKLLRVLCFRGVPETRGLRAQVWKVLLGYLPVGRYADWSRIEAERRGVYASYRAEMLATTEDFEVSAADTGNIGTNLECQELFQEIKNDVERTRRDLEYFRRPSTRASLLSILYIYARLNPGVRYVQGMNEVAAVVLYVMSSDPEFAEVDAFWCFSELMVEIKEGFMQAFDHTGEGVHAIVEGVTQMLKAYDYELAKHLQKNELSLFVFVLRWCTVLFAQDATLPDVVRIWDCLLGDPCRFEFVHHTCLAVILSKREVLMQTHKQFALAEVLQSAPRTTDLSALIRMACAICGFERRRIEPAFPPQRSHVVEELSEWASEVGAGVSRTLQENIAPAVIEKASLASAVAADKAQALSAWLEETAPARQQALEQASTRLSSLWDTVKSTGAVAVTKGSQIASGYAQKDTVDHTVSRLGAAAEVASTAASGLFARAAAVIAGGPPPPHVEATYGQGRAHAAFEHDDEGF